MHHHNRTCFLFLKKMDPKFAILHKLIAEIFSTFYFSDLAKSLSDTNLSTFDPSKVTAFDRKLKHSDCKLIFPPIPPEEIQQIIESIPSSKATSADKLSVQLPKIAAP